MKRKQPHQPGHKHAKAEARLEVAERKLIMAFNKWQKARAALRASHKRLDKLQAINWAQGSALYQDEE